VTALFAWIFSREGSSGMVSWGYRMPFIAIGTLCAIPIPAFIAAFFAKKGGFSRVMYAISLALGLIGTAVSAGCAAFIVPEANRVAKPVARPLLLVDGAVLAVHDGTGGLPLATLAFSSDPHWGKTASNAAAREAILRGAEADAAAGRLDAFFMLGDTTEFGFQEAPWIEASRDMAGFSPHVRYRPVMGNHDALLGGQKHYLDYFDPSSAVSAGKRADGTPPFCFRVDAGRLHVLALNLLWDSRSFDARQREWLVTQLASFPEADYVIVVSHAFIYSSGYLDEGSGMPWYDSESLIRDVAPLLEGKVDLVVSGHNHYMEWLEHGGTAYAVVGVMGGVPDPEPTYKSPASVWFHRGSFGRLDVELRADGLRCAFRDPEGTVLFEKRID